MYGLVLSGLGRIVLSPVHWSTTVDDPALMLLWLNCPILEPCCSLVVLILKLNRFDPYLSGMKWFLYSLCGTCRLERDALPLFQVLTQNYKSSIDRDPAFREVSFVICDSLPSRHWLFADDPIISVCIWYICDVVIATQLHGLVARWDSNEVLWSAASKSYARHVWRHFQG